ncbi:Bug family tripartite tricarboxylate transporter substrate binding protein [Plastoroseomonas hellenica]|uniref:Bug family tripartite tricarboxylate transporter substrate binding protein n=1 Tax=Plastoroseomonas hellenica TaxID=2687306 RepID=UPI001BAD8F60|nr:tripartite tricarboxylate transporter substrate binding protein [Plastoroseomonas hellenica]MBR0643446.1 tripartite tricarboxylate transporter substrate binding protein [Plastoroseomonas hellenica]
MTQMDRRSLWRVGLAAGAAAWLPGTAGAQAWPARPIRLVVPFAAGTTTDLLARILSRHLSQALGQSVVVDNRSGAGGNLGVATVAKSPPDGYTLVLGTSGTHGVNASLYRDQGYDPVRDFAPIMPFVTAPAVLAVGRRLGVTTLAELVALAKQRPGALTFASAGNGTTGHLSQALLDLRAGIQTVHVPYRSGAQAITDLLASQVDAMFYHYLPLVQHFREGSLLPLAVTAPRRAEALAAVPTMQEGGLPDFVVEGWWALYAPAGTPPALIAQLNAAANALLRDPEAIEGLRAQGVAPIGGTPERLQAMTREEVAKWRPIIAAAGIQTD